MNAFSLNQWQASPFWGAAGEAMLEFLLTGTIVALVAMVLRRLMSGAGPSWRYAAAALSMTALVGAAGLDLWDHWPVPVLYPDQPLPEVFSPESEDGPVLEPMPSVVPSAEMPVFVPAAIVESRWTWATWRPRLIRGLPALWLFGAPLTALLVGLGWTGAARLRKQSMPLLDEALLSRFHRCQSLLKVTNVAIAVSERIRAPIVVGILKPVVLLPPALLTSLTCDQWEMILLHELAHVRRLDNFVNLLQRGVETVLFFHPAMWWTSRWMRLEREHCCDAVVLESGRAPHEYAETLAVLALPGIAPQLATAAMSNHELLSRMRHILGTEDLTMTISWKKLGLAAAVFAAIGGFVLSDGFGKSKAIAQDLLPASLNESLQPLQLDGFSPPPNAGITENPLNLYAALTAYDENSSDAELDQAIANLRKMRALFQGKDRKGAATSIALCEALIEQLTDIKESRAAKPLNFSFVPAAGSSKRSWSPEQAAGKPDVPSYADHPNAWAARVPDHGTEWLRLDWDKRVNAAAIVIHESFNPGAITSVHVLERGPAGEKVTVAWNRSGSGPSLSVNPEPETASPPRALASRMHHKNVLAIPLAPSADGNVVAVTVHLDEKLVPGWNEIDAVGLIDAETGETHWADRAVASSTYADAISGAPAIDGVPITLHPEGYGRNVTITGTLPLPSWSPKQATGAPNVDKAGDDGRAWASATQDGQKEWLELTYDPPVEASALMIYESYNPGAITDVLIEEVDPDPTALPLPKGSPVQEQWLKKPTFRSLGVLPYAQSRNGLGITTMTVKTNIHKIRKVRLLIDSPAVQGWNEIDAVGLLGLNGQMHWATDAKASSWFGESREPAGVLGDASGVTGTIMIRDVSDLVTPPSGNLVAAPAGSGQVLIDAPGLALTVSGLPEPGKPAWSPAQATGAPDVKEAQDDIRAWASATPDGQKEWLELTYDPPVEASAVLIYESFNPGAVVEVAIGLDAALKPIWSGRDPVRPKYGKGTTTIPIPIGFGKINRVLITLDSRAFPGWNEIDAVGLSGDDSMHWATGATASSWFGEPQVTPRRKPSSTEENVFELEGTKTSLVLELGRPGLFECPAKIRTVDGHDPSIVTVDAVAARRIRLTAGAVGTTTFRITDETGHEMDVTVSVPAAVQQTSVSAESAALSETPRAMAATPAVAKPTPKLASKQKSETGAVSNAEEPPFRSIWLKLDAAGAMTLNDRDIAGAELVTGLEAASKGAPEKKVVVLADAACPFEAVKTALDACKGAGVRQLQFERAKAVRAGDAGSDGTGPVVVPLSDDSLVVNLNETQPHFLRMVLMVAVEPGSEEPVQAGLKANFVLLRDRLLLQCREKKLDELRGSVGMLILKEELLATIRSALPKEVGGKVLEVLFQEMTVQ